MRLISLASVLLISLLIVDLTAEESAMKVASRAGMMIARFEQGRLRPGFASDGVRLDSRQPITAPTVGSGPLIAIEPTKHEEYVGVVELNGRDLAALGATVFPQAFALLDHEYNHMRIIGATALIELSGIDCGWQIMQSPWDDDGEPREWALKAKRSWIHWYSVSLSKGELNHTNAEQDRGPDHPRGPSFQR